MHCSKSYTLPTKEVRTPNHFGYWHQNSAHQQAASQGGHETLHFFLLHTWTLLSLEATQKVVFVMACSVFLSSAAWHKGVHYTPPADLFVYCTIYCFWLVVCLPWLLVNLNGKNMCLVVGVIGRLFAAEIGSLAWAACKGQSKMLLRGLRLQPLFEPSLTWLAEAGYNLRYGVLVACVVSYVLRVAMETLHRPSTNMSSVVGQGHSHELPKRTRLHYTANPAKMKDTDKLKREFAAKLKEGSGGCRDKSAAPAKPESSVSEQTLTRVKGDGQAEVRPTLSVSTSLVDHAASRSRATDANKLVAPGSKAVVAKGGAASKPRPRVLPSSRWAPGASHGGSFVKQGGKVPSKGENESDGPPKSDQPQEPSRDNSKAPQPQRPAERGRAMARRRPRYYLTRAKGKEPAHAEKASVSSRGDVPSDDRRESSLDEGRGLDEKPTGGTNVLGARDTRAPGGLWRRTSSDGTGRGKASGEENKLVRRDTSLPKKEAK